MNVPFDPDETNGAPENDDPFGENSMTWGAADPEFDRMLRERIGPPPTMTTPAYAFERVLLAGRRRRSRKLWAAGATAALVVMAGTAGTTVAFSKGPSNGVVVPPAATVVQGPTASGSGSGGPSQSASPGATSTNPPTPANGSNTASAAVQASPPQCQSADLQLTVSAQPGGNSLANFLIVLQNDSGHTCTIDGYPDLEPETKGRQSQSTKIIQQGQEELQNVTLARGQSASTLAEYTFGATAAPGASPAAGCSEPSYYLAVTPPGGGGQLIAPITDGPATICGNGVIDTLPFTSGNTG
jgi:hypothetical protein